MTNLIPVDLKYTTSHEWVREEAEGIITLGITEHAQSLLGEIVFVELPELEKQLKAGEGCAVVESVKAAADVYCPVSGEVVAVNEALIKQAELINTDPYQAGWLCRVRVSHPSDLARLLSAQDYQLKLENELI